MEFSRRLGRRACAWSQKEADAFYGTSFRSSLNFVRLSASCRIQSLHTYERSTFPSSHIFSASPHIVSHKMHPLFLGIKFELFII
jgi:hypothetical protein